MSSIPNSAMPHAKIDEAVNETVAPTPSRFSRAIKASGAPALIALGLAVMAWDKIAARKDTAAA